MPGYLGWRCALKGRRIYRYLVVSAAFIASGYEHSIANMTLFALSWFGNHSEAYTLAGIGHNLLWVTLGNTLSVPYSWDWVIYATPKANRPVADKFNQTETAAG
ncbi:nitrite transporter [Escherichia coli]|uniref:Nitrite transporter n=1 Tax=Escherichia coli TaxID=562 RepID=A0A377DC30_ECOLX|nr:nitrite transporter [Escherichia coli]